MANRIDVESLINRKFNKLTLLKEVSPHVTVSGNIHRKATFKCDCGNVKDIQISSVINSITVSCGCHSKKMASNRAKKRNLKHGKYNSPEYNAWISMKKRCLNKNHKAYNYYGGRGIKVCDKWIDSFENFIQDIGLRPSKKHSLDRINNQLGYFKENCRWSTKKEQARNQRSNRLISAFGEEKCFSEWCEILGVSWNFLFYRLYISKKDYSLEQMIEDKKNGNRTKN